LDNTEQHAVLLLSVEVDIELGLLGASLLGSLTA